MYVSVYTTYIKKKAGLAGQFKGDLKMGNERNIDFAIVYPTPPAENDPASPNYYKTGGIECIDAIRAMLGKEGFEAYCRGNVIKYNWRYKAKNGLEDLKKAAVYQEWLNESVGASK
jgi:hypothetical protein